MPSLQNLIRSILLTGCALLTFPFAETAHAEAGDVDRTFGTFGTCYLLQFSGLSEYALATQSDGKMVVAGIGFNHDYFQVARITPGGVSDFSFGTGGSGFTMPFSYGFTEGENACGLAIQSDQKIIAVAQATTNGNDDVYTVKRLKTDGSLDTTFNGTGTAVAAPVGRGVAIQSDGKIVVVGGGFITVRYKTDGTFDTTFNSTGRAQISFFGTGENRAYRVLIQPDGKILVAGGAKPTSETEAINDIVWALARYNSNGSLDTTFNGTGKIRTAKTNSYITGLALQTDGKIVAVGGSQAMRFNGDGTVDSTFNAALSNTDLGTFSGVAIQSDGKIAIAGWTYKNNIRRFKLTRLNSDGSRDSIVDTQAVRGSMPEGRARAITLQGDKIILAGDCFTTSGTGGTIIVARFEATSPPSRIIGLSGDLAFNSVPAGQTVQRTLTITNSGNSALAINGITYPPGFNGDWSGNIAAGTSHDVTVTFAPTAKTSYGGTISVLSDQTEGTSSITCSGEGLTAQNRGIKITGDLKFGLVPLNTTSTRSLTITNSGNAPLTINGIEGPAGFVPNLPATPFVISPAKSQTISVSFTPTSAGAASGTMMFDTNSTSGSNDIGCAGVGVSIPDSLTTFAAGETINLSLPADITDYGTAMSISGLPDGLKLVGGIITGIPTKADSSTMQIKVLGSDGKTTVLTVPFIVEALPSWAVGGFTTLIPPPDPADTSLVGLGGFITITAIPSGYYTGTLYLGANHYTLKGQIDGELAATRGSSPLQSHLTVVTNAANPAQNIQLSLQFLPETDATAPGFTGTLSYQSNTLPIGPGWQNVWNKKTFPAWGNKSRTLNVAVLNTGTDGPDGTGYATVKLDPSGWVTWSGKLGDGQSFTCGFMASPQGDIPLYAPLDYPGGGALIALEGTTITQELYRITLPNSSAGSWLKFGKSDAGDRNLPDGFSETITVSGAEYRVPGSQLFFGSNLPTTLHLYLTGGLIENVSPLAAFVDTQGVDLHVGLQLRNKTTVVEPSLTVPISLSVAAATGLLSSKVTLSDLVAGKKISRTVNLNGLYIPDLDVPSHSEVSGFFLLPQLPVGSQSIKTTPVNSGAVWLGIP